MPYNVTMNAIELIKALGGTSACARLCGVTPPSVSEWRDKGSIPKAPHIILCVVAERLGIAKRQELRPEDYWLIWPDLKAPKGKK